MIPFVDLHCHLLAGLDDGPRTEEDALAMCRLAHTEGARMAAATAHQNERYPDATPERIRQATGLLAQRLREEGIGLTVFPCAEIMVYPEIEEGWRQGNLLSIADRRKYLLVEQPHGLFVDLLGLAQRLQLQGLRVVLAHPERQPELLHEPNRIEQLIAAGCLVQVSSGSITDPKSRQDWQALKDWLKRDLVHLIGSDGHSPNRRPPRLAEAYRRIAGCAGAPRADRICSTNGMALLQGLPFRVPEPQPRRHGWFSWLW